MSDNPVEPTRQAQTTNTLPDQDKANPNRLAIGILVVALIVIAGVIVFGICSQRFSEFGHPPPPPSPASIEVTAAAQVRATHLAAAKAVAPSLVRETGVITSIAAALYWAQPVGYYVYFDGSHLWVNQGLTWLAIDPESREIVVGPISLERTPRAIAFAGHQLWFLMPNGLQSIDADTGKLGSLIEAEITTRGMSSLAYDGERLWFFGKQGLQPVDLTSHQVSPPIVEFGSKFPEPCMAAVDDTRTFLLIGYENGSVRKYDLQQHKLLDISMRTDSRPSCTVTREIEGVTPWVFDDSGLWIYDQSSWQLFDTTTGVLKASTPTCADCTRYAVLGDGQFWIVNSDLWAIQSFDAVTGQPDSPIPLLGFPGAIAFDGQRLWIMLFEPDSGKFQGLQYIVPNAPAANIVPSTLTSSPTAEAR